MLISFRIISYRIFDALSYITTLQAARTM